MQTILDEMRGARPPWLSVEAISEIWEAAGLPVFTSKDAECLFCEAPDCFNCKGGGSPERVGRPSRKKYNLPDQLALFEMRDKLGREWEVLEKSALDGGDDGEEEIREDSV